MEILEVKSENPERVFLESMPHFFDGSFNGPSALRKTVADFVLSSAVNF